jgi:predicted ATP-grasp superfamily ATP-dependent carboligase
MLKFIEQKPTDLKGSLLIISGVSIGNVPALTCDEFIKENGFKRIAYFQTSYVEPSIGYLPS